MKTVYYVASSLDGFIADAKQGVDWLEKLHISQDATGYNTFFADVEGLVMGRRTFDFVHDYGQWPYGPKPTWVCTSREMVSMHGCNLQPESDPLAAIKAAEEMEIQTLWVVGGGKLAQTLIQAGCLSHISVSIMPVLLFNGSPLVQVLPAHLYLTQTSATEMDGFTQIEYELGGHS